MIEKVEFEIVEGKREWRERKEEGERQTNKRGSERVEENTTTTGNMRKDIKTKATHVHFVEKKKKKKRRKKKEKKKKKKERKVVR